MYERLREVLDMAFDQASNGKGAERHANDLPFEQQPMQMLAQMHGLGFITGQAGKKLQECHGLPKDRAIAELLGAIVYSAGAVIALQDGRCKTAHDLIDTVVTPTTPLHKPPAPPVVDADCGAGWYRWNGSNRELCIIVRDNEEIDVMYRGDMKSGRVTRSYLQQRLLDRDIIAFRFIEDRPTPTLTGDTN